MDQLAKYKDLYGDWYMDDDSWKQDNKVKEAFHELYGMWMQRLHSFETPPSCIDIDKLTIDILDKYITTDATKYQSIFVALILHAMDAKAKDDFALKHCWILTHGWKSRTLSGILAKLLEDENIFRRILQLHSDPTSKKEILAFFSLR